MGSKKSVLVWMDLEMTGLDPETCAIVEMAIILTDGHLNELDKPLEMVIWQPDSVLEQMSPFVRKMHTKSGLLEKIRASKHSVEEAEHEAIKLVSKHVGYREAMLAGNSIYQDRRFLWKYMPAFEQYLHYRQIDVSTVKELGQAWYNRKYKKGDDAKHTALYDIKQSIEELKWLRDEIFIG